MKALVDYSINDYVALGANDLEAAKGCFNSDIAHYERRARALATSKPATATQYRNGVKRMVKAKTRIVAALAILESTSK